MTHKVFVSYRSSDTVLATPAIACLRDRHGSEVFVDVDALRPGTRFDQRLLDAAGDAHVVVALIGPGWSQAARDGALHFDDDYVRQELSTALSAGATVLPVLLDGGERPAGAALPAALQPLSLIHAHPVRADMADQDLRALCDAVDARVQERIDALRATTDWTSIARRLLPRSQHAGGNLAKIARLLGEQLDETDVRATATGRWGRQRAQRGFVVITRAAAYLIEIDDEYQAVNQVRIPCTDRPRAELEHNQRIAVGRAKTDITITSDSTSERIERVFRAQAYLVRDALHRSVAPHL